MNSVAVSAPAPGAPLWPSRPRAPATRHAVGARSGTRRRDFAPTRENPRLPGVRLPEPIVVASTVQPADFVLLAVPLQHLRAVAARGCPPASPVVVCAKGIETRHARLPLEILAEPAPGIAGRNPVRAELRARDRRRTAGRLGDRRVDAELRDSDSAALLGTPSFRLYGNDDPIGAQVGGAAKNVIAIAAGAVIGAGLGENARAALITRGLAELSRLAVALGGRAETVMGLSGLGDLLLTCTGSSSRNYSLGLALGRGETLAELSLSAAQFDHRGRRHGAGAGRARRRRRSADLPRRARRCWTAAPHWQQAMTAVAGAAAAERMEWCRAQPPC